MFGTRLLLCALTCAQAQVVIEKFAGVDRSSGNFAWEMGIHSPGTAWDAQGNAYVAAYNQIWKVRPDGIADIVAGKGLGGAYGITYSGEGGPATQANFSNPMQPKRDAAGNTYFMANSRLLRVGTDGLLKTVAGNGIGLSDGMATEGRVENVSIAEGKFAIDPTGVVYLADDLLVRRLDLAGNITVIAAGQFCDYPCQRPVPHVVPPGTPRLYAIKDLDVNPSNGDAFITERSESGPFVIHKLSNGVLSRFREVPFSFHDMAVDRDGDIFIARVGGPGFVEIQRLDGDVKFMGSLAAGLRKDALFLDPDGRVVYLSGMTVRRAEDGSVWHIYPNGQMHASPDGTPALETRVIGLGFSPVPLAVNQAGEVYFAEISTCRVRKFDRDKRLRTVYGSGTCDGVLPPQDIALGPDDKLWVTGLGRAVIVGADGGITPATMPPGTHGSQIVVDKQGRVYATTSGAVVRLERDGNTHSFLTGASSFALGTDAVGNIYFSDLNGVYRVEGDYNSTKILSGDYGREGKFVMDAQGRHWREIEVEGAYALGGAAISSQGDIYATVDPAPDNALHLQWIYKRTESAPRPKPSISAAGVVNGASYAGNAVSPGELVSVFGDNFGLTGLQLSKVEDNHLPTKLGPVKVTFNGIAGAITAATPKQINVFVPSSLQPSTDVKIQVFVDDAVSDEITLPVVDTMFGLSSLDQSGSGQGAILNANGTVNSRGNPAQRGSLIVLFGTGEGKVVPDAGIGAVNLAPPYPKATKPLFVRIGGQQAEIVFAGGAPTLAQGVYQINARIPASTPPGDVTVEVMAEGGAMSKPVTVAVQ